MEKIPIVRLRSSSRACPINIRKMRRKRKTTTWSRTSNSIHRQVIPVNKLLKHENRIKRVKTMK